MGWRAEQAHLRQGSVSRRLRHLRQRCHRGDRLHTHWLDRAVPHYAAAALCGTLLTSARAEHSRVQWPDKGTVQQMVQYENKCQWTECQGSTPVPSTSSPTSTPSTTAAPPPTTPEPEPSCLALEAQIEECVQQGNVFECQHCASADVGNRCCSCQGSSTSTATLPGTVTETTTTSPALPGQCKAWCASNGKSWEKKCKWTGCAGCPSCNTRRLGASNRLLV